MHITERKVNMRYVEIGTTRFTKVICVDKPGIRGACHEYQILSAETEIPFAEISFQNGPVKENGINGIRDEDLINILIDRLEGFQTSDFACRENEIVLEKLEESLKALNIRTAKRI